jgi:hypothetical protein
MAADLLVVPTVTFRLLFVLAHDHRRLVHVAVPGWVRGFRARCGVVHLENAIVETDAPLYLSRDRDSVFCRSGDRHHGDD